MTSSWTCSGSGSAESYETCTAYCSFDLLTREIDSIASSYSYCSLSKSASSAAILRSLSANYFLYVSVSGLLNPARFPESDSCSSRNFVTSSVKNSILLFSNAFTSYYSIYFCSYYCFNKFDSSRIEFACSLIFSFSWRTFPTSLLSSSISRFLFLTISFKCSTSFLNGSSPACVLKASSCLNLWFSSSSSVTFIFSLWLVVSAIIQRRRASSTSFLFRRISFFRITMSSQRDI